TPRRAAGGGGRAIAADDAGGGAAGVVPGDSAVLVSAAAVSGRVDCGAGVERQVAGLRRPDAGGRSRRLAPGSRGATWPDGRAAAGYRRTPWRDRHALAAALAAACGG